MIGITRLSHGVIIIVNEIKILFNDGYNEFRLIKNYNRIHQYTNSITFSCLHISSFSLFHLPPFSFSFFLLFSFHHILFLDFISSIHFSSSLPIDIPIIFHPDHQTPSPLILRHQQIIFFCQPLDVIYLSMFINYRR